MLGRAGATRWAVSTAAVLVLTAGPAQAQYERTIRITAPGVLSRSETTYVLDADVTAPGTAFTIAASNVTLDLNGHSVIYNAEPGDNVHGVFAQWNKSGLRVTNGNIVQGPGNGYRSHAVYLNEVHCIELDHLSIGYQGDDTVGILAQGSGTTTRDAYIHDNVIRPNGTKRPDPGLGYPTHYGDFAAIVVGGTGGRVRIHNNDIRGKGHQGIHFRYSTPTSEVSVTGNTIMMASPVRNGYGIVIGGASHGEVGFEIAHNTIVQSSGRGILVGGDYSDDSPGPGPGDIHDNFVDVRESADSGEYAGTPGASTGICIRFGAHHVRVHHNRIRAWAGANAAPPQFATQKGAACIARGLKIHSGPTGRGNVVCDNVVTATTTDAAYPASGIYATGDTGRGEGAVFRRNVVVSNSIIVDLNGADGAGSHQTFTSNVFARGDDPQGFHAVRAGYWTSPAVGNLFVDNRWVGGADPDDLALSLSGGASYGLTVRSHLDLRVTDANGNPIGDATVTAAATGGPTEVLSGTTDANGRVRLVLTDYTRSGVTYPPTSEYARYTPHLVTISASGYPSETKTFVMSASHEAGVVLDGSATEAPLISDVTALPISESAAVVSWRTDAVAASVVEYGPSMGYGNVLLKAVHTAAHSVKITDLSPGTYHFRVVATSRDGLSALGVDHTFTVLPFG